ncbi:MAG: 50S ribosomal protein L10 [Candidatus Bathyarchaeia archaeon]
MSEKRVVEDKVSEVKEAKSLLMQYKVMGIANLNKVRAAQLQEIRRKMRGISCLRVFKNSTMKFALSESENKKNLKEVINHLSGSNIFLFTNLNPFKLKILLDKNKVLSTAKAGDIAPEDIVVPAGNTGMPPGPIISQLNAVGLPTRIESGSVWINKNTVVARRRVTL